MVLLGDATTMIVAILASFLMLVGVRLAGNFMANLQILRAYKFDE
jgi:hypothetical protein